MLVRVDEPFSTSRLWFRTFRGKCMAAPSPGERDLQLLPGFPLASSKERPPRPRESCTPPLPAAHSI